MIVSFTCHSLQHQWWHMFHSGTQGFDVPWWKKLLGAKLIGRHQLFTRRHALYSNIARSISSLVPKFYYCRWQDGWHHSCRRASENCSCPRRRGRPTKPLNFATKATPIHHFIFSTMGICAISGWWHRRTERERAKHCCCSCVCWTKWRMIKS